MKWTGLCVVSAMLFACGGSDKHADAPGSGDGGAASIAANDAGPRERPFAKSAGEAQSLIDDAVEEQHAAVFACVVATRTRRGDPHARIVVSLGIDQEGHLIGLSLPKGPQVNDAEDKAFLDCMRHALAPALFPSSHAGIITVKKTFEDVNGQGVPLK